MSQVILRDWQTRCAEECKRTLLDALETNTQPIIRVGACVGSGKSTMMAHSAHDLSFGEMAEDIPIDYHIFVAPNRGIIGSHGGANGESFGIIGALLRNNIWPTERITADRLPGLIPLPVLEIASDTGLITGVAAVFTYQYLSQKKVQDTILEWAARGLRIAMHYDEIHHVPVAHSTWANALLRINGVVAFRSYWSGTWWRTDERAIMDQHEGGVPLTFFYSTADGIRDGHTRPLSFWVPLVKATTIDTGSGLPVDDRPVTDYLEQIPLHIREEMFNPHGWFVESMVRRADEELERRRRKYPDAGCLVTCPPGFHGDECSEDTEQQDRIAEILCERVRAITGKRTMLILNGDPDNLIREYRESDVEFLVAVNRISEGCDIPRLMLGLLLRDLSGSELLFQQILGRIVRRRPQDDDDAALVIMPPIHAMCEFARRVHISQKDAIPKKINPCERCRLIPCKCPCRRCGKRRPCKCPCGRCGQKPCICLLVPPLEIFAELEKIRDAHIIHGTDIEDQYAQRAGAIRDQRETCAHRDLAGMAYILQCDAEINGVRLAGAEPDPEAMPATIVANAQNWQTLRDTVPPKVSKLAHKFFGSEPRPFQAAWRHINHKLLNGEKWSEIKDNPIKLSFDKLKAIHVYLDRVTTRGGAL